MKNRRILPLIVYVLIMILVMSWASGMFDGGADDMPYSQIVQLFRQEQVKSFEVQDDVIYLNLHTPYQGKTSVSADLADVESFRQEMHVLLSEQAEAGILQSYQFHPDSKFSPYDLILPFVIVGLVLLFAWAMLMGRMNNQNPLQNFGKARTVLGVPDGKKVTFADVAGAD